MHLLFKQRADIQSLYFLHIIYTNKSECAFITAMIRPRTAFAAFLFLLYSIKSFLIHKQPFDKKTTTNSI